MIHSCDDACLFFVTVTIPMSLSSQVGCYVLPMRWQGMPIMLVCPQPAATAVIATPTTTTPTTPSTTPTTPKPTAFYHWSPLLMPPYNNNPFGQQVVYPPPYRNP